MDEAEPRAANQLRLRHFIDEESDSLLRALRVYVARGGLAIGDIAVRAAADELLSELTIEALSHAERFDGTRQPVPWLLGIAANLVKRKQAEQARDHRREPLARDIAGQDSAGLGEDEIFDRVAAIAADPAEPLEAEQRLAALLAPLSEDDRRLVRLAVVHELDGAALGRALGIQPGAARVRLHRALGRLRKSAISQEVSNG